MNRKRILELKRSQWVRNIRAAQVQLDIHAYAWCDACQLGDAMFVPFVEALKARFAHRSSDIDARTCLRLGKTLAALDTQHGPSDPRLDTGLRVMSHPIWRYQGSGVCVCEALAGDHVILIYKPDAMTRHTPAYLKEHLL